MRIFFQCGYLFWIVCCGFFCYVDICLVYNVADLFFSFFAMWIFISDKILLIFCYVDVCLVYNVAEFLEWGYLSGIK